MINVAPARLAAYRILREVEKGQAHSDELLRARFVNRMTPVDRNLATALVLGVLRWQIALDQEIKKYLAKPNARLDTEVRIALRLGALQLLRMERIPAHAAITESVEMVKAAGHSFAARMVNAVLRKMADAATTSAGLELALGNAHPAWLVERWTAQYGAEVAQAICAHGQQQSAIHLRIANAATEDELLAEGFKIGPGALLTDARTLLAGDVVHTVAFSERMVRMQDEGSQLVAELAAASLALAPRRICDACAAPGGKTLLLAERHPQAHMVACELSAPRAEELAKRLAPLGRRAECKNMDAALLRAHENFDLILVDAPCSGTGTLGRNPEIRHRLRVEELERQAERQRAILAAALRALRPGGHVLYSTCSLEREENDEVVAAVLAENTAAHQLSLAPVVDRLDQRGVLQADVADKLKASLTPQGALRLMPGALPTDGFFVALLERAD
jgi:16S rRNA (cytosine967-C5)-methyltransferase